MANNPLKPHEYDGIQEYDNNLPNWWVWTFVITVVFGIAYWFYYQVYQMAPGLNGELERDLKSHQAAFAATAAPQAPFSEETAKALQADRASMDDMAKVFAQNCAPCHGAQGQGVIGPNLTDDHWIHGNKPEQIYRTIEMGVVEKGMVPWKGTLTGEQIQKMTSYVMSMQGTNPPNPKAPQGEKM